MHLGDQSHCITWFTEAVSSTRTGTDDTQSHNWVRSLADMLSLGRQGLDVENCSDCIFPLNHFLKIALWCVTLPLTTTSP